MRECSTCSLSSTRERASQWKILTKSSAEKSAITRPVSSSRKTVRARHVSVMAYLLFSSSRCTSGSRSVPRKTRLSSRPAMMVSMTAKLDSTSTHHLDVPRNTTVGKKCSRVVNA